MSPWGCSVRVAIRGFVTEKTNYFWDKQISLSLFLLVRYLSITHNFSKGTARLQKSTGNRDFHEFLFVIREFTVEILF